MDVLHRDTSDSTGPSNTSNVSFENQPAADDIHHQQSDSSCTEKATTLRINSISEQLLSLQSNQEIKTSSTTNNDPSLSYEAVHRLSTCRMIQKIIQLVFLVLFACLIGILAFILIIYAFDVYWSEQLIVNNSSLWSENNERHSKEFYAYDEY